MTEPALELDPGSILSRLPMSKHLQTVIAELLGYPVGFASVPRYEKPGSNPTTWVSHEAPYAILYPLWTNTDGDWSHPDADAEWLYQVTMVGKRGDQSEWMRDRIVTRLFGRTADGRFVTPLEVDGIRVMYRDVRDDTGIAPDSAVPAVGVLQSDLRFSLGVTRP